MRWMWGNVYRAVYIYIYIYILSREWIIPSNTRTHTETTTCNSSIGFACVCVCVCVFVGKPVLSCHRRHHCIHIQWSLKIDCIMICGPLVMVIQYSKYLKLGGRRYRFLWLCINVSAFGDVVYMCTCMYYVNSMMMIALSWCHNVYCTIYIDSGWRKVEIFC